MRLIRPKIWYQWIDQRTPRGSEVLVHLDKDEESLYACFWTQKVAVKGVGVELILSTFCATSRSTTFWMCY